MSICARRAAQTSLRPFPIHRLHPKSVYFKRYTARHAQPLNFTMYPQHTIPTHISKVLPLGPEILEAVWRTIWVIRSIKYMCGLASFRS